MFKLSEIDIYNNGIIGSMIAMSTLNVPFLKQNNLACNGQ